MSPETEIEVPSTGSPLYTVIVPTLNRQSLLNETLESVRAQTLQDFECLVVDDGSHDAAEIAFPDARFRILRHGTTRGIAAARNTGIAEAQGKIIAFLDDDDLWTPTRLDIGRRQIRPGTATVCGAATLGSRDAEPHSIRQPFLETVMDGSTPHLGTVSVHRSDCPRFNEKYSACEDLEWWLRLAHRCHVVGEAELGWLYRRHDGPRGNHGVNARIDGSRQLLADFADYFDSHPRAKAFRLIRIGWLSLQIGDRRTARQSAVAALRADRSPTTLARSGRLLVSR